MLRCEQVSRELSDAVDGSLPLHKRLLLRLHLALCPPCRAMEHSLRFTRDVLRKLSCAPPASPGSEAVEPPGDR
ncbi:MAG TPA: zf-HC2 domain-containing protein [Polyangiales bacterium]